MWIDLNKADIEEWDDLNAKEKIINNRRRNNFEKY